MGTESRRSLIPDSIAWAVFLACSWTWCIGMILPSLMVRDGGIGGFLIFLIPNAIGAAAMGWVLRRDEQSHRFVAQNEAACRVFSWVTILFHVFALCWLATALHFVPVVIASCVVLIVHVVLWNQGRCLRRAGFVVFVCSVVIGLLFLTTLSTSSLKTSLSHRLPLDFWVLLLVCAFGFCLCPYLDLTFHRVRQSQGPHTSKVSFTLGFCVFFVVMMAFSLVYSEWLGGVVGIRTAESKPLGILAATLFATHFGLQAWFTIRAHTRELSRRDAIQSTSTPSHAHSWLVVCAVVGIVTIAATQSSELGFFEVSTGEIGYRLILGFYGLMFPAFMLLVALPGGGFGSERSRHKPGSAGARWVMCAISIVAASPFYIFGFLQREESLLAPGLAIVIACRFFLPVVERLMVAETPTAPHTSTSIDL